MTFSNLVCFLKYCINFINVLHLDGPFEGTPWPLKTLPSKDPLGAILDPKY